MPSSSFTSSAPRRMMSDASSRSSGVGSPPMQARLARKWRFMVTSRFDQSVSGAKRSVIVKLRLFRIQDNLNYPEKLVTPISL